MSKEDGKQYPIRIYDRNLQKKCEMLTQHRLLGQAVVLYLNRLDITEDMSKEEILMAIVSAK